jgi:hypothetical protein
MRQILLILSYPFNCTILSLYPYSILLSSIRISHALHFPLSSRVFRGSSPSFSTKETLLRSPPFVSTLCSLFDATGLAAREWLAHAEYYFTARESALGIDAVQGGPFRVHSARAALVDDALRWLTAMPQLPADWAAFRTAFLQRFSSVPAAQVREAQLQRFVDAARRVREKLTVDGLQRYTTLFLQQAGEIPSERMTDATKRTLYAQGLPPRYAELVLTEDAGANPPPLHEVAQCDRR